MRDARSPTEFEEGYTYVSIIILLFGFALATQTAFLPNATEIQREREAELIFRGLAYRDAVERFYKHDPDVPKYPSSLDDLVLDPRVDNLRHLRKLYRNPFPDAGWRLVSAPGGGISGVSPDNENSVFKSSGFPEKLKNLEGLTTYSDWKFSFEPDQ